MNIPGRAPDGVTSSVLVPEPGTDERVPPGSPNRLDRVGQVHRALGDLPVALLGGDVLALIGATAIARGTWVEVAVFAVVAILCRAATHYYRQRMSLALLDDLPRVVLAGAVALALTYVIVQTGGMAPDHGSMLLLQGGVFVALGLVAQAVTYGIARYRRRRRLTGRRTLVVGADRVGKTLTDALFEHPELGLTPVGFADPGGRSAALAPLRMPVLTDDMNSLARTIVDNRIDTTILALYDSHVHVDTVMTVQRTGCELLVVPEMFEMHHDGADVERIRGVPLIRLRPDPTMRPSWWVKRALDVVAGGLGLLLLSLPLAVVSVVILIESGRPVMFWQERVGVDGRPFRLCKFRSMRPESELESQTTWNIGSDPRVSRIGRMLRRTSIDEIPQLWNIVRGNMSIVGPRPERPGFVAQFSEEHERYWARHRVPVGLTGLAQVNGLRGDTSIAERARFDNYYIANWSLWLDLKIVLLTFREVLGARGR